MNKTRLEWKVGIFVLIALVMGAGLVIKFSRGPSVFAKNYRIQLKTSNVSGIVPGALCLMAGVPIGNVEKIALDESGKSVIVTLRIQQKYQIHADADFSIKQSGFLGDQYVSVVPKENKKPMLENNAVVHADDPFDLQEVARSAAGLLQRVDETAKVLNQAVARIDKTILSGTTLSNLNETVLNFRGISERALATLGGVDQFVRTNTHPLSASVSNLVVFSEQMKGAAEELHEIVTTNRAEVSAVLKNVESATAQIDRVATDLQSGKGLAGAVLKDEEMRREFAATVANFGMLSSNLNKFGLFYKPKPKKPEPVDSTFRGRSPRP